MSDTDRRERFWWRWLARLGIAGGLFVVHFFFSHFNLGRRTEGVAERWGEFWTWAFTGRDGPTAMIAGYLILTVSFYLRLLTDARNPNSTRTISLLLLVSSGISTTLMFLLALVPICFR